LTAAVSLVIPTWNAGPEFPEIFARMKSQKLSADLEIIVIDSGSRDGTVEFLRRDKSILLIEIPNSEFNHGLTRNLGVQKANGEIVVFATQDAQPNNQHWIQRLVERYDDPDVAGVYSRQIPRPDANPFIKDRLKNWVATHQEQREQKIESPEEFSTLPPLEKLARIAFDNVSSSVRRKVALKHPFSKTNFGEDIEWSLRVMQAGYKILYEPESVVVHSHNKSIWYEFRRVYLDHQNLHRLVGMDTITSIKDIWSCSRAAIAHLLHVASKEPGLSKLQRLKWQIKAVPFGFSQNLAQFLGVRSVAALDRGSSVAKFADKLLRRGI